MVTDERPKKQQWRINLGAKCGSFNLQIQATEPIPILNPPPNFSIVLRIRKFILKLESDSRSAIASRHRKGQFGSMFRGMLDKIRLPLLQPKKKATKTRLKYPLRQFTDYEELMMGSGTVLRMLFVLVYLLGLISATFLGLRGGVILSTFIWMSLFLIMEKKYTTGLLLRRRRYHLCLSIGSFLVIYVVVTNYLEKVLQVMNGIQRNYWLQYLHKGWRFYCQHL